MAKIMAKITLDQRAVAIHAVHVGGRPVASVVREFCEATGHPAPRHPQAPAGGLLAHVQKSRRKRQLSRALARQKIRNPDEINLTGWGGGSPAPPCRPRAATGPSRKLCSHELSPEGGADNHSSHSRMGH